MWPLLVALLALAAITVAALRLSGVTRYWAGPYAVARALLQLTVLGFVLAGVIESTLWTAAALAVMFVSATTTAVRRLGKFNWGRWAVVALVMGVAVAVALTVIFTTGALVFSPRYLLAAGGIVIGNCMSIATLTGRRLLLDTHDRWEEVEGWLALGARPRAATLGIARAAAGEALIPTVDQTRTTGLVTLPGAFVGAVFGGASPLEAGQFQVLVLAAVIAAGALTSVGLIWLTSPATQKPARI